MKYDFTTKIDRTNRDSLKWHNMSVKKPNVGKEIVPLSTADMEFFSTPDLSRGLQEYIGNTILGYSYKTKEYQDAVAGWMKRQHGWEIDGDWVVETQGVVNALFVAVGCFTNPGDGVILLTPIYNPFYVAVERSRRKMRKSSLIKDGQGIDRINFEELEKLAEEPDTKLMLFCNPHNPTGRVWTEEELKKVSEICLKNGVLIVSDEVHSDIIMPGYKHTTMGKVSAEQADNCIVCVSPSKTFNIAGLKTSNIIIPNNNLRDVFCRHIEEDYLSIRVNTLGYKACEIAYNNCEEWLKELLEVLAENSKFVTEYLAVHLPKVKVTRHESTYLMWLDFTEYGLSDEELTKLLEEKGDVFLEEGSHFGTEGIGWRRINIACPKEILEEALKRMSLVLSEL